MIFSIGDDSRVLPDHNDWRSSRDAVLETETPAKIVLRALVSTLAVWFFLNKREASLAEIEVFHVVLRNASVNAHLLYRLKQYVVNRPHKPDRGKMTIKHLSRKHYTLSHFYFTGIKFYYMTQMAYYQRMYGLFGSGKDTELTERFHKKVVKQPLETISNVFGGRLVECARHMQKHAHIECLRYKAALSGEVVDPFLGEVCEDADNEDDQECSVLKYSRSKSFTRHLLSVSNGAFHGETSSFTGFPWLHPFVTLIILFDLMVKHLLFLQKSVSTRKEYLLLQGGMSNNGQKHHPKLLLIEGYKMNCGLRCGDLDGTQGMYYIRSNQAYKDDRRGPIANRQTYAVNSFVFAVIDDQVELVRILGILLCMGVEDEEIRQIQSQGDLVYCAVVVMSPAAWGYLPFHVYKYSFLAGSTKPDLRILNTREITAPCFCVSVQPDHFREVDNLMASTPRFYNIPHTMINPREDSYTEYRHLCNSDYVDAFRTVEDMNEINDSLLKDVAEFKVSDDGLRLLRAEAAKEKRKGLAAEKKAAKRTGIAHNDDSECSSPQQES